MLPPKLLLKPLQLYKTISIISKPTLEIETDIRTLLEPQSNLGMIAIRPPLKIQGLLYIPNSKLQLVIATLMILLKLSLKRSSFSGRSFTTQLARLTHSKLLAVRPLKL